MSYGNPKFDLFSRDQGPWCLVGRILMEEAFQTSTESLIQRISGCGLHWYWSSERDTAPMPDQTKLPTVRTLTQLTKENVQDLVEDLEEIDQSEEYRWVWLFGLQTQLNSHGHENVAQIVKQFIASEGPIEVAIFREGDSREEYIYFTQQVSPRINCLWAELDIQLANAHKVRPYKTHDWTLLHYNSASFPIFLNGSKNVLVKYDSVTQLAKKFSNKSEECYGWDKNGFRVRISGPSPKDARLFEVNRISSQPEMEEALKAFRRWADETNTAIQFPDEFHDLREIYNAVRAKLKPRSPNFIWRVLSK